MATLPGLHQISDQAAPFTMRDQHWCSTIAILAGLDQARGIRPSASAGGFFIGGGQRGGKGGGCWGKNGGGIFDAVGTVVMNGGSIVGNTGGGIAIPGGTLRGVSITNNTLSSFGGAGVNFFGGHALIENCLIANNTATDASADGGGVRNG